MNFTPLSEKEVLNLLPDGEYDFVVEEAVEGHSQAGNPQIKIRLSIWDSNNVKHTVWDYLSSKMMYKVKHFADSVGLESQYESGGYTDKQCERKTGRCKIIIEDNSNSSYPPKNSVKDYVKCPLKPLENSSSSADTSFDDDLPF